MNDPFFVRGLERQRDLPADFERFLERHRALGRFALHQLHDDVVRADVVQRANIRVIERRDHFRFPLKTLVELFGGDLDGDIAAQARIASPIDLAHAAGAELAQDFVGTQMRARLKRHIA